jgi:hypothetical protein
MSRKLLVGLVLLAGCKTEPPATIPLEQVPGHDSVLQDNTHKETPRLVPAEAYIRTYLQLFGGLTALQVQQQFAGASNYNLFDSWNAYLGALGLPNYTTDFPRGAQTNAMMIATFERLGIALCDKAVERDLKGALPVEQRVVFGFELTQGPLGEDAFAARFDLLHRTFLGYPARLAPTDRIARFRKLYDDTAAQHPTAAGASRFTPAQAGWAAICYGLIRHPEFHLY